MNVSNRPSPDLSFFLLKRHPMQANQIFQEITPDLAKEIITAVREADRNVYRASLASLAGQKKLRPVFVQRKPVDQQMRWMHDTLKLKSCIEVGEHLLQMWLLTCHTDMLTLFLDDLRVEHAVVQVDRRDAQAPREQAEEFLKDKPRGANHFASYGSGSFIFSKRAHKGKTTKKAIRGDPDKWWFQYNDLETRGAFLRAYAAERTPELFEVVEVRTRECGKCGGTGQIRHVSVKQLQDGRHEWKQVCPRCFKARLERSVAYR